MAPPKKPEGQRARDISPTALRLPQDLRELLERECAVNGTSMSAEVVRRLRASFPEPGRAVVVGAGDGAQSIQFTALTGSQRALLMHFGLMPPEKQLALLTLLKR